VVSIMRKLFCAIALSLLPNFAAAQSITTYDYYKAPSWLLMQQYLGIYFDTCLAEKNDVEAGHRLSIGRAISGSDFIFVHGINDLIRPNQTVVAGKVWINGRDGYDFSNVEIYDSTAYPGQKYVTIYLANGFIDQLAKASTVEVEFSQGRSRHSLKGSRDIISRLNECMDAGLQREFEVPAPTPRTPLNWTAGVSQSGSGGNYIAIALPPVQGLGGVKHWLAYADNVQGRFDIRVRDSEATLATKLDIGSATAKRAAANLTLNGTPALASLMVIDGNNLDILDVPAADLAKLGVAGPLVIKPLDPSASPEITVTLTADAAFGPGAITAAAGETARKLTVDALVGKFNVRGRNPNGNYYYGTAETTMESGNLKITWTWSNGKVDTAVANLVQNVLTAVIAGYDAPAVYTIGKDRVWRGSWDNGRATEVAVPKS
jgi:hypothetical protein